MISANQEIVIGIDGGGVSVRLATMSAQVEVKALLVWERLCAQEEHVFQEMS